MQSQGLMILFFMLFIVPIVILFTNPNIFFIIISVILFFVSLRNIHVIIFDINYADEEPEDELADELEYALNIDIKKFGKGIKVAKDLIFILFFVYCIFHINTFWIRLIGGIIIFYWFIDILKVLSNRIKIIDRIIMSRLRNILVLLINTNIIIIITIVICNKFMKGVI